MIFCISPSLFLTLKNTRGASSVSIITYLLVGLHTAREQHILARHGVALHSILGLGFSRLDPVNNWPFPHPTRNRLLQQKPSKKEAALPQRRLTTFFLIHTTTTRCLTPCLTLL